MNTPDERIEREFERFASGDGGEYGALYRRLAQAEPPRRLDRNVLGEAARALRGQSAPRRHRWMFGVGSAAGVVLAAGIAWQVGQQAARQQVHDSAVHAPKAEVIPVQPVDGVRKPAAPAPLEPAALDAAAPAPPAYAPPPAPAAPPPAAPRAKARPVPPPPPAREQEAARPERRAEEAAAPAAASAPPAWQEATKQAPADAQAEGRAGRLRAPQAGTGRAAATPAPSSSVELRRDVQLAPVEWLARIRALRDQGRHQQARESLHLFQRAHPTQPVPADLAPLLD